MKQCVEARLRARRQKANGAMAKDKVTNKQAKEDREKMNKALMTSSLPRTEDGELKISHMRVERGIEEPVVPRLYKNWVARARAAAVESLKADDGAELDKYPCWEIMATDPETGWKAVFYIPRAELGGKAPE